MNKQLRDAYASVPEIAQHEAHKERVASLLRSLPDAPEPEAEAARVADEALTEYLETGTWPDDVNERARDAYTRAVGAHAVRGQLLTLNRRFVSRDALVALAEMHRSQILGALGEQLSALLSDARKHTDNVGDVRTADQALTAGGKAAEAFTALRALVPVLVGIREAQWEGLRLGELTGPDSLYQRAKDSGFGDVDGISDDTPAEQFLAMQERRYSVGHLVWLAQMNGVAYVPDSVEDVIFAQDAYESRHAETDALPILDFTPRVEVTPPAPEPKPRPVHARKPGPKSIENYIN
ncbi:hypothetical protein [Streptomyces sp. NBC_01429]|uniref:hypothetical protein n=1 Tax=Streptomyces sp. NBC_01429 TaxID=2903862 RepID=UPI002E288D62|nr:hypothetical protein [Streptomyces sp. NBC_01429]